MTEDVPCDDIKGADSLIPGQPEELGLDRLRHQSDEIEFQELTVLALVPPNAQQPWDSWLSFGNNATTLPQRDMKVGGIAKGLFRDQGPPIVAKWGV